MRTLKDTTLQYVGEDGWSRPLFQDSNTSLQYVDVTNTPRQIYDAAQKQIYPTLHTITSYGEPDLPVLIDRSCTFAFETMPLTSSEEFNYMMLSRMQMDCKYAINTGSTRSFKTDEEVDVFIADMLKRYHESPVKPDWITVEHIDEYRVKIKETLGKK